MTDTRLIEVSFPIRQASLDSVHEKNVRHGHLSTLHIWPARRPLAACRAALIATLLPDPGDAAERSQLLRRLAGTVRKVVKKKKLPTGRIEEVESEETEGGILHWGRESSPDLAWFRERIREAFGGRAPRVLDPFSGGGAIPLEAMRLGCEVTAADINPVAWFILKCSLEYPRRLAGRTRPLPGFILGDREFMADFLKAHGFRGGVLKAQLERLGLGVSSAPLLDGLEQEGLPEADLAWQVRAWGRWVLEKARAALARYYPVVDGKPAVAYLWARTVRCKNCRSEVPLLKTRWLCKKDRKRVLLTLAPREGGVDFGVQRDVPRTGAGATLRENDKRLGAGTMSRSGATCPTCQVLMSMEDLRAEGKAGRLGTVMTSVVVEGPGGKEYRLPHPSEVEAAEAAGEVLAQVFAEVPFGIPEEPTPGPAGAKQNSSSLRIYGLDRWRDIFTPRQLVALGTVLRATREAFEALRPDEDWREAIAAYLACALDRLLDRGCEVCTWQLDSEKVRGTFARFALPMTWDFVEVVPHCDSSGGYGQAVDWVFEVINHLREATPPDSMSSVVRRSAIATSPTEFDVILTDPPYYDAIAYADMMDFFYVWLRRCLQGLSPEIDRVLELVQAPQWDHAARDGELIDNPSRFDGDREKARYAYEDGMFRAFQACHESLTPEGRLVIVFAHKHPDAWETLVSAIIRAGFVVDGSWPVQTERQARTRSLSSAALSSSVWLVCKKRPAAARPGWDNRVLEEMRDRLHGRRDEAAGQWTFPPRLREFWDAGVRGPDFVWSATGPALEAYSRHPLVKKANEPGQVLTVAEFLRQVRRLVVDFVVGRVLSLNGGSTGGGLDDLTTYYLLHRNDFRMAEAPASACILYALTCGLSDTQLADQHDLLIRSGSSKAADEDVEDVEDIDEDEEGEDDGTSSKGGAKVRLKPWNRRTRKTLGMEGPGGRPAPLIDQVHRLMQLWKAGEATEVDEYLEAQGLRGNAVFPKLLQALIELCEAGTEERALLESLSNHLGSRGRRVAQAPGLLEDDPAQQD